MRTRMGGRSWLWLVVFVCALVYAVSAGNVQSIFSLLLRVV